MKEYQELKKSKCIEIFERVRGGSYDVEAFIKKIEDCYPDGYKSMSGGIQPIWTRLLNKYIQDLYRASRHIKEQKISRIEFDIKDEREAEQEEKDGYTHLLSSWDDID